MNSKLKKVFWVFIFVLMLLIIPIQVFAQENTYVKKLETKESNIINRDTETKQKNIGQLPKVRDGDDGYTVPFNGSPAYVFRGGNSFFARDFEVSWVNRSQKIVGTTKGVSLNVYPSKVSSFGGAYRIDTIPLGLNIIQRGAVGHYEIVPAYQMYFSEYQDLLNEITTTYYVTDR